MQDVAEFQQSFDKHPTMPGRIFEIGEYLAMMLYEDLQYDRALETFERALEVTSNRYHLLYGAAISARQAEQPEVAARYFSELLRLADFAEVDRPEVAEARQFLQEQGVED